MKGVGGTSERRALYRLLRGLVGLAWVWGLLSCAAPPESREPGALPAPPRPAQTLRLAWISSYPASDPWTLQIQSGMLETLARSGYSRAEGTLVWEPIAMNGVYTSEAALLPLADAAIAQAQAFRPDLVIVSDDEAIHTVIPRYPDAQVPFVYCGLNGDPQTYAIVRPNVTGVLEVLRPEQNLEIARAFVAGTGRYAVLSDASFSGAMMAEGVYETLAARHPDAPPALWVTARWAEWQTAVRQAAAYDFILLVSANYVLDSEDNVMDQATLLAWTVENAPVPVFAMSREAVRYGAVAGLAPAGYAQGARAAELALHIVQGTSPAVIPVDAAGQSMLLMNLAAARRWDLAIPVTFPLLAEVYQALPAARGGTAPGGAHD